MHLDILDNRRQELLPPLLLYTENFILGGGTGLALQLAHRKSFDFDFFSSSEIPKNLLEKISRSLSIDNIAVDTSDELTFFTKNQIKVTLLYYPFKSAFPIIQKESGLRLFCIQDIALQKAYTIGRRGEYRDYFDLYTILKNGYITLEDLIQKTKKIYGGAFDEKMFLQQLVYFDDMLNFDIIPISSDLPPTPKMIKKFLEELVKSYLSL